jgi:hypothetical protein
MYHVCFNLAVIKTFLIGLQQTKVVTSCRPTSSCACWVIIGLRRYFCLSFLVGNTLRSDGPHVVYHYSKICSYFTARSYYVIIIIIANNRNRQYFESVVYIMPSQHILLQSVYHCNHIQAIIFRFWAWANVFSDIYVSKGYYTIVWLYAPYRQIVTSEIVQLLFALSLDYVT